MSDSKLFFIVVAAGKGLRMGSQIRKQYLTINELPILAHTLLKFTQYIQQNEIILVVPQDDIGYCKENILKPFGIENNINIVSGGEKRQESVANGINFIKTMSDNYDEDVVLIHDGVRPFIDSDLIESVIKGAIEFGACIPAIKTVDTIKKVSNNIVTETLDRTNIYQIQTPQAFSLRIIIDAIEYAQNQIFFGTDDASLVEFYGQKVAIVNGLRHNIKITTQEDLKFANTYFSLL